MFIAPEPAKPRGDPSFSWAIKGQPAQAAPSVLPIEWTMTFNGNGKLLHAIHSAAPKPGRKVSERKPSEIQGKPVQATDPAGKAILIK